MNTTFERATPEDAEALLKVQMAAFDHDAVLYPGVGGGGPPGYDQLESVLQKIGEAEYYKIVHDGEIVGGIVLFDEGEGHYHLDLIYIDPVHHDKGIGSEGMLFLERTYAATKWSLHTPSWAVRNQHFYEKFGYVKVGEEQFPDILLFAYEKQGSNE